jgi:hypothetical protein
VETERIAVAVRPREGYEAVDLGFQLARGCWVPLFAAHALVVVPLAIALFGALRNHVLVALAILWWLKPLYDRVALGAVGRAARPHAGNPRDLAGLPPPCSQRALLVAHLAAALADARVRRADPPAPGPARPRAHTPAARACSADGSRTPRSASSSRAETSRR